MVIIVSSTAAVVQASGIQNSTTGVQGATATAANVIRAMGGFSTDAKIVTPGGFSSNNIVSQFEGAEQETNLIQASNLELTGDVKFVVFFPDFARGTNLFSVVGTKDVVEQFFDRSPFFFSSHETDPNTLRNLSEAQQFLIFSQANISSYDNFRNTISPTQIITVKGDELSTEALEPLNLVTNGSFEQGFSSWQTSAATGGDIVEVRTTQPTSVGFNDSVPVSPPDGNFWAYLKKVTTTNQVYIKQTIGIGVAEGGLFTDDLGTFSFKAVFDDISTNRQFQCNVIFYLGTEVKKNLIYRVSGIGTPTIPVEANVLPQINLSLSAQADIVNSIIRNLRTDLNLATFRFDRIEIWFIVDTNTTASSSDTLIDDVRLTMNVVPDNLKRTKDFSHVITMHPTASGFPFTISGSDGITQIDVSPPFFDQTSPASGTSFNFPNTPLNFHVKDAASPLDLGTINVRIDGVQVVSAGSAIVAAPWSTATSTVLAPNDILYSFTRSVPFDQQATVVVSGTFADFADVSNGTTQIYEFKILGSGTLPATISGDQDATPPTITPTEPEDLDVQISPNTTISWTTTDNAAGVNPLLTKLMINGFTVLQNDTAINGTFSRAANSNRGFDYTYAPAAPFSFGQTVTGTIIAADFSTTGPNTGTLTYQFTISPTDTLEVRNFFLDTGEFALLTSGTIASVEVVDFTYGVASGTTSITINGHTPAGLFTTVTGALTNYLRFDFLLEPEVDFRSDIEIFVRAENRFPGAFPFVKEQTFALRPGYDVFWPNKSPDAVGGPEIKFPTVTNVPVLVEVTNFAKNFGEGAAFFEFLTENLEKKDLGAIIVSNIDTADLPATLVTQSTHFEYGKTINLQVDVADLQGNQLSFTHVFTIEPHP